MHPIIRNALIGGGSGGAPAIQTPVSILGANLKMWIDFSDFATLYQDNAGTTPVTATGQQMGKAMDQSGNGNHIIQPTSAKRGLVSAAYPGCVTLDGIDDNYYTASTLDLSTVSAVTVYLAFRQYNEIGSQCILEHSPDYSTNRAFNVFSPIPTSPPNRTAIGYKGGASNALVRYDSLADAPVKKVIVASVDLAQSLGMITACRMNGVVRTPAFAETILGGGNFLNAVLYIGSRAGTSLYSAADLCQIAIATGIQSAGVMAQMEAFLNSKIGAY